MKKFLFYITHIILFSGYVSCNYDRIIQIEQIDPKGVLNAILTSDTIMIATVSRTGNAAMEGVDRTSQDLQDHYFIENAEIQVSVNGRSAGSMKKGSTKGEYILPEYIPAGKDEIKIEVSTEYGLLSGEVRIPVITSISSVDTQRVTNPLSGTTFFNLSVELTIEKEYGENNFYMLTIQGIDEFWKGDSLMVRPFAPSIGYDETFFFEHALIGDNGYNYEYYHGYGNYIPSSRYSTFLFADASWIGERKIQLILKNCQASYAGEEYIYFSKYSFQLSTISESYYLYKRSKILQTEQNDFFGETGLREPIPTYSNVKGGYGLVGAKQTDTYEMTVEYGEEPPANLPYEYLSD